MPDKMTFSADGPRDPAVSPIAFRVANRPSSDDFISEERARHLYRGFWPTTQSSIFAAIFLMLVLWPHRSHFELLLWVIGMMSIVIGRVVQVRQFCRIEKDGASPTAVLQWINFYTVGLYFSGLQWGSVALLFLDLREPMTATVICLFLTGVAAIGSLLHAAAPRRGIPFLLLVLVPLSVRLFPSGGVEGVFLGAAVLLYLGLLTLATRLGQETVWGGMAMALENQHLRFVMANEHKTAEHARREVEIQYQDVFENMTDGLMLLDVDAEGQFVVVNANPAMQRLTGIALESVRGLSVAAVLPPAIAAIAQTHCQRCVDSGLPSRYDFVLPLPDGMLYVDSMVAPLKRLDQSVYRVIIISRDMTERQLLQEAVASREQEFRTLIENSPELIVRYDLNRRRVFTNPAFDRVVGLAAGEALGTAIDFCWRPFNMTAADYGLLVQRVMDFGVTESCLLECVDAKGRIGSHHFRLVPEYGRDGQIVGVLGIGQDVSMLRQQEILEKTRAHVLDRLGHGADLTEVLGLAVLYLEQAVPGGLGWVGLVEDDSSQLTMVAAPNLPSMLRRRMDGIGPSDPLGRYAIAAWLGEDYFVADIAQDPDWRALTADQRPAGYHAFWSVPVIDSVERVRGVLSLFRTEPGFPTATDYTFLRQAHDLALIALERKSFEEKLKYQASYDALTNLPNRFLFGNRLQEGILRADRYNETLALLFIDLDHFKDINDSFGHDIGDQVLIIAAQRIRHCLRNTDIVARFGGDEFVALLQDSRTTSHLSRIAQSILDALGEPIEIGSHQVYVSASIGISCYPDDADSAGSLLTCADQAMYAAKERGRNGFCSFTASMQSLAEQRVKMTHDLRNALHDGQLSLHFQPIVELSSGRVVKAEALLRWKHPKQGMIPPSQFVPIAEETGLIHPIGHWVFEQAARMALRWRNLWPGQDGEPPIQVGVNMSPRQFVQDGHETLWLQQLEALGVAPEHIVLEITEGLLLDERMRVAERLARFQSLGIQIALDDFGTGYSAMAYLKKYPINYLKIDRAFVGELCSSTADQAIAEAMITMAHKLGLKTIAEGVETDAQRDLLAALGCDYVQGYLYAKPLPAEEFEEFLKGQRGTHEPVAGAATTSDGVGRAPVRQLDGRAD